MGLANDFTDGTDGALRSPPLNRSVINSFQVVSAPRGCTRDEGRSLEAGLQEQASNHLKLQR